MMASAIKSHLSPEITEKEVRRRLATCYHLLIQLARKHEHTAPYDGSGSSGDVTGRGCVADRQEAGYTSTTPCTGSKPDDEEGSVAQSGNLGAQVGTK